jgi:serine phosphatase RsbU (regulator of sigma subunit)/anti-sigma regulatory factor (Ser/Thr protein kinase)
MRNVSTAEDQLRRIDAVTDTRLAHLDLEQLLVEMLERVRELLSVDTAAVLLYDENTEELVATAATGIEEEVRQGVRIPLGRGFAGRIALEKRAVALERVDHATVLNPLLWSKGIHSLLGVPLLAGGEMVGVLHIGTLSTRHFGQEDTHLLQLVGDRLALAISAQLSGIERATASALQRSLLPVRLPTIPGVEFATRYVPGAGSHVSGDWYDIFQHPGGSWGVVIGDVTGHGLVAATVMGRLRSVLRAYAMDHADPSAALGKLDQYVSQFEPGLMATIMYAVFDPAFDRLQVSLAGHLGPAIAPPDQPATLVDLPVDPPIGARSGRVARRTSTVELPAGALLCAFTDGLVERRGVPIDDGLERLRATLTAGPAESVCANVMAELIGAQPPMDDVAVLIVRQHATVATPTDVSIAATPESLAQIRTIVRRWLSRAGADDDETSELLVAISEACSNVVEHAYGAAGGKVELRLELDGSEVLATVTDHGRWRMPRGEQRGRGTTLMRAFSDSLTVEKGPEGTTVGIRRRLKQRGTA